MLVTRALYTLAPKLKQNMLQQAAIRGDYIALCWLIASLVVVPVLLSISLPDNQHYSNWLIFGYILLTSISLSLYIRKPKPKALAWYAVLSYSGLCGYTLISNNDLSALFWPCLAPPLIIASLGIRTGLLMLCVFLAALYSLLALSAFEVVNWVPAYPKYVSWLLGITLLGLSLLAVITESIVQEMFTNSKALTEKLRHQALKDELTGLANRRAMRQSLSQEMARSHRTGKALSLLMVDIDHFKQINDTHGHDVGDQALKWVAEIFRHILRASDIASRWGGEEFLILLPETDIKEAQEVAERIRTTIDHQLLPEFPPEAHFTVSCGVANSMIPQDVPINDIDSLINLADEHLYHAKSSGRNRVEPNNSDH